MNENKDIAGPSLTDPEAKGGDIAEGGFKFQDNHIIAQVPTWLSQDGFTEMIREALGDVEAKFFVPEKGEACEFIEYKNYKITPSKFWPEVQRFREMDECTPETYRRFVLVCTGISEKLEPMITALRRVRDAFPFYDGAAPVQENSFKGFASTVENLGQSKETADFIFRKVWCETDAADAEKLPQELFGKSLLRAYPFLEEAQGKEIRNAYSSLQALIVSRKNRPIQRIDIEKAIWNNITPNLRPAPSIRIHTNHEHEDGKTHTDGRLEFDWNSFCGGEKRIYPPPEEWNHKVIGELLKTRKWIMATNRYRNIELTGHRRLSASIAIGSVFSAVSGFNIDMNYRNEIWSTNTHSDMDTPDYPWDIDLIPQKTRDEIVVTIGVKKNVVNDVQQYLGHQWLSKLPQVHLYGDGVIYDAKHANKAVSQVKDAILNSILKNSAKKIHLFIASPAHFALFLGHRLNATCAIQCYERTAPGVYVPTCLLGQVA
jgi:hypothetical protein